MLRLYKIMDYKIVGLAKPAGFLTHPPLCEAWRSLGLWSNVIGITLLLWILAPLHTPVQLTVQERVWNKVLWMYYFLTLCRCAEPWGAFVITQRSHRKAVTTRVWIFPFPFPWIRKISPHPKHFNFWYATVNTGGLFNYSLSQVCLAVPFSLHCLTLYLFRWV